MATVAGRKPIEQVQVGDVVKAIDPATGLVAWKRVTERHERTAIAGIVRVTIEDAFGQRETLTVTQNHPYLRAANDNGPGILNAVRLDPGGDWSAAGMLRPGDRVQSGKGAYLEVVAVEPVEGLAAKVYNFEVADHHTYAVGDLEAWAHNASDGRPSAVPPDWVPDHNPKKKTLRWYCPCNPKGNWVRYNLRGKYYKIFLGGCARDKDGNKVPDDSPEAHIPEGDFPPQLPPTK